MARRCVLLLMRYAWVLLAATGVWAQPTTNSITVTVTGGSVSWSTASGNPLIPGSNANPGDAPVTVVTSWSLQPVKDLQLYAYFTSSTAAMAHTDPMNTADIPAAAVHVSVNGGAFTAISATVPLGAPGAGVELYTVRVTGANRNSSRTDTLAFNIDLGGLPDLPPDTYTGTLLVQAQAVP